MNFNSAGQGELAPFDGLLSWLPPEPVSEASVLRPPKAVLANERGLVLALLRKGSDEGQQGKSAGTNDVS